jgi:tRNA modification GTPase
VRVADAVDTIAACATAAGTGGVAIVRLSGPRALAIAGAVCGRAAERWEDRRLVRVRVAGADGRRIDDGLAVWMAGPRSFTGEDVVELQVHGGAVNVGMVLGAVVGAGARLAEPGEFTRRALEAGRISVAEAEAMLAVVQAPSARAWSAAQHQLGGALAREVAALRAEAVGVLAEMEAAIDFPEEGLAPATRDELRARLGGLADGAAALERSFQAGRALTEGIVVALVGAVNAGKSSLLNALVGEERVLVADEPGTTRDFIEVRVIWDGVAVTLIDTAGERPASATLERRGIELGRKRAEAADIILRVVGPDAPPLPSPDPRELRVASKLDLAWSPPPSIALQTSTVTGLGLSAVRRAILRHAGLADDPEAGSAVILTERQRAAAATAATHFLAAHAHLSDPLFPLELLALDTRTALTALATLTGDDPPTEDVLTALFARFCIGK